LTPKDALRRHLKARWEAGETTLFTARDPGARPRPKPAAPPPPAAAPAGLHPSGLLDPGASERGRGLLAQYDAIKDCVKCPLGATRTRFVFGTGNPQAELLFVGEAPGEQEDRQGLPFVGPAGQLLTRMLGEHGIRREDVFICNVLKCRPPNNRPPAEEEIAQCSPYLEEQIKRVGPKLIVALGRFAAQTLLRSDKPVGQLRGRWYPLHGAELRATYHPSAILRNPNNRAILDEDLKIVKEQLARLHA